jgi:hypothetical protein
MERANCTLHPQNGSLVPSPPQPQPPDPSILFSFQWIDQVFLPMPAGRGGGGGRYNDRDARQGPPSQSRPAGPPTTADYYTGEKPGFIVGCLTPMMNECFARSLFGLPANRKVSEIYLTLLSV